MFFFQTQDESTVRVMLKTQTRCNSTKRLRNHYAGKTRQIESHGATPRFVQDDHYVFALNGAELDFNHAAHGIKQAKVNDQDRYRTADGKDGERGPYRPALQVADNHPHCRRES